MLDWIDKPAETLRDYLSDTVYSERGTKRFADLPTQAAPTGQDRARIARERLEAEGFDVLYVDASPPGAGWASSRRSCRVSRSRP